MNNKKSAGKILSLAATAALLISAFVGIPANAAVNTPSDMTAFDSWNTSEWANLAQYDTGKITMAPGKTIAEMNFAWYSETAGTPQVKVGTKSDLSDAKAFTGTVTAINRTNGVNTYTASNKVTVTGLSQLSTYYYTYSINGTDWSATDSFKTQSASQLQVVCVGDPQIGASTGSSNIAYDTFSWNNTLSSALNSFPDTNFILSVGDQINQASDGSDNGLTRELQYAGFLYPSILRNVPLATAIGNHESMSADYSYHYNVPNASNLGKTASGGDYYFNYGDVLFIVLNSNNRNSAEHEELMKKAIADPDSANAKWKIAVMHHDIYGTGAPHSDIDGANLRSLFAPLMDEFNIDVCMTGHDHSFARSYQMIDGKAVTYQPDSATNPVGTLYMALNSATGSKFYDLNPTKQYYVNVRNQEQHPNYSVLSIVDGTLSIKTMDVTTGSVVDNYTITKNGSSEGSLLSLISSAKSIMADSAYASTYTQDSRTSLETALSAANALLDTADDAIPEGLYGNYDETIQGNNGNDMLDYYGYAATSDEKVESGYAAFLDKTRDNTQSLLTDPQVKAAMDTLQTSIDGLVKVSVDSTVSGSDSAASTSTAADSSNPKTGDNTGVLVMMLSVLLFASAAGLGVLRFRNSKKNCSR